MKLQVTGCSHHQSSVEIRERLAFSPAQARAALLDLRQRFPQSEAVLLSTCNRVELYLAAESDDGCPTHHDVVHFLAQFHGLAESDIFDDLFERTGEDAIRHLFMVAASLDSMVIGEAQILSQVKQAFVMAQDGDTTGPLTHLAFEAANRVAKRVQNETSVHKRRVSIPSVAVADYAVRLFERFDDKQVLVLGAGEMGEETVRYLMDEGAQQITIVNRSRQRAVELAACLAGTAADWDELDQLLSTADLVVSTTGAREPIMSLDRFRQIHRQRSQQTLFVLDLAVPRDFEPAIGDLNNVYLYSVDDLQRVCEANRRAREKEWPKAEKIIESETRKFITELHHRATAPTIRRLKTRAEEVAQDELERLLNKLPELNEKQRAEIDRSFGRLVNKLLHPPLESLRHESREGAPHGLLAALQRLFQISD